MRRSFVVVSVVVSGSLAACGSNRGSASSAVDASTLDASGDDAGDIDASTSEASADTGPDVDKSATCASTFGAALTDAFGRLDGTVVAVVPPGDPKCAVPNATHLVIQVMMNGAPYRMVVDVLSNRAPVDVLLYEIDAPLAAGAWAEGWHAGVLLDYVTTLNVHSASFVATPEADLVKKITNEIDLGAKISVFSTSAGSPSSTHLVHRNLANADGAIVLRPDSANPHYILLRFSEQTF